MVVLIIFMQGYKATLCLSLHLETCFAVGDPNRSKSDLIASLVRTTQLGNPNDSIAPKIIRALKLHRMVLVHGQELSVETMTSSSYEDGSQLSVKQLAQRSVPRGLKPSFSARKRRIAHVVGAVLPSEIVRRARTSGRGSE